MDQFSLSIVLYLAPILASLCVSAGVGSYLVTKRHVTGARSFGVYILLEMAWTFGLLFELLSPSLLAKMFWDDLQWVPTFLIPLAALSFAIGYTGQPTLKTRVWLALTLVPLAVWVMVFTPGLHDQVILSPRLIPGKPFTEFGYQFGTLLAVGIVYAYLLFIAAAAIMVRLAIRQQGIYRLQTLITTVGFLIPLIGTGFSTLDIRIGPQRDISPYVFIFTNIFLVVGFLRYRVFELIPIARDEVIDSMEDGEIVLDSLGRLVDINPAARALIRQPNLTQVGQVFGAVAGDWFWQVDLSPEKKSVHQEITLGSSPRNKTIDLRITHLDNRRGEFSGYLLILRDISEQKQAAVRLEQAYSAVQQQVAERTAELSETLANVEEEVQERRRAEEALQRQYQQSSALVNLSSTLLTIMPDYTRVLDLSVRTCAEIIGDGASIFLYHPGQAYLELIAVYNPNAALADFFRDHFQQNPVRADEGSYGKVIQTCQPLLIPVFPIEQVMASATPERKAYFQRLPLHSVMYAPLMIEGTCIGVLGLARHRPDRPHYSQEDLNFLKELADLSAIAIWHARTMGSLQRELAERRRVEETLRASEAQLRESEEKYRALFSNSGDAILVLEDGQIIDCNDAAQRLFAIYRENLLGCRPEDLSPEYQADGESSAQKAARFIEIALRQGYLRFEWVHQRSDGELIDTEIILDTAGGIGGPVLQATIRDMTVRKKAEEEIKQAYASTLEGWAQALELRELETAHHSDRVVGLTLAVARKLGLSEKECVPIQQGARLHDIGKMGIPDSILLKAGPLDEKEWEVMRQHPVYAYNLLSKIHYLQPAMVIPYSHHERWDGSGYPQGLKGEAIPLSARIFSVVDVWDALTSDRPYRKGWSKEVTSRYLVENAGKLFDPKIVEVFLTIVME